ncbi:MAG: tetratricopeptide repeat protein [Akkermansia sp.]|nr:tetratricopeptide repeat protein [Akkermansia sp.]
MMTARPSMTLLVMCTLALAGIAPLQAQGTGSASAVRQRAIDPAEHYLTAYRLCRESEQLAARQNYTAAINKGVQAEKVLAGIVKDYPQWKSNLVSTRRRLLAENLATYRKKSAEARIPTGRQPGRPVAMEMELPGAQPAFDPITSEYRPIELPDYETTDKKLYNALAAAQEECRKMAAAYRELNAKYEDSQRQLSSARIEQQMYKDRYDQLQQQVSTERVAGNEVVNSLTRQLAELEAKYRASEAAREQAEARIVELETTLAKTQEELARVTRERDALKAENEQLRAIVELNSPEKTKALLDQNLSLDQQLKQALARIAELEGRQAGSDDERTVLQQQLDTARDEANRLRDEMSGIFEENMGYRRRVSELTERLNNIEADLNRNADQPPVDPALAEENELLREVIAKQRRSLAMQEEGRKLLIETYKQLKNQDPATLSALQRLDEQSSLELTDAERRVMEAAAKGEAAESARAVREGLQMETLADLASKAFSKGRYTAAEQLYRTLHDAQPNHVAGLVNLGTILLYRGKCDEALEFFARAIRISPDLAISYYLSGVSYYRLDRLNEAAQMFSRTIELDPGNAEAFFYLANIEGVSGQYDVALKHFAAAVKLKPVLGDAHYNMARLYAEMKQVPEAARAYDRAIQNGAEPDPEFEKYLRNHPDSARQPGEDIIQTVNPEAEAAEMLRKDPDMERIIRERDAERVELPAVEPVADPAGVQEPAPEPDNALMQEAAADPGFLERLKAKFWNVQAAPSASPAGAGHETDKARFGTVRVRAQVDGERRRVQLRLKRPEPQRIRERGGEIQLLKKQ